MQAAIFDLDGTLVDTYEAHFASWQDVSKQIGHGLTEQEFARQFGRPNDPIIRELFEFAGVSVPDQDVIDALADVKEADFRDIISGEFPEMPGATTLLQSLHDAGWRLAGGTSAPQTNADLFREELGCGSLFETIVTGDDVTEGKPDPEVFLLAAERLGVVPNHCVVIEDAAAGIEAARRAGMASVGFCSRGRTREELSAADLVIDDLSELGPEVLRELIYSATGAMDDS
ncbi:MAG: HAD family phosphatase [Phycisphaerales bacterium]|nr:HAD family phosphatase [Phycisphaerales bacterium]